MADTTITRSSVSNSTSISSFLNMLREDYMPRSDDWLHSDAGPTQKLVMGRKKGDLGGKKTLTAAFTARPQGIGFTTEGYDFPNASASSSQQPEILPKEIATRHRLTFESQQIARKSVAAFAKPKAEEMRLLREELALRYQRNLQAGPYDVIGRVASQIGGSPWTTTMSPRNARRYTASLFFASGTHYMRTNMAIQLLDASAGGLISSASSGTHALLNATPNTAMTVSSVDDSNPASPTFTPSADPDVSAGATDPGLAYSGGEDAAVGDLIIAHGSRIDANANLISTGAPVSATRAISEYHSMNGLGNINTDTTLYTALFGLDRTVETSPALRGIVDHNSGTQRDFTDRLVEYFVTRMKVVSGNSPSKLLLECFTFQEVTREFRNLRQFSPIIGRAGVKDPAVVLNDLTLPYVDDWNILPGLLWGIHPDAYEYWEWYPLQSPDEASSRWVNNKAIIEFILMKGGNVFCPTPWRVGLIDDIAFDTTALRA